MSADVIRGNMARAIEESGRSVEDVADAAGLPADELQWMLTTSWDDRSVHVAVEDIHRVFLALYPDNPLTFHEWFSEPEAASAP